MELFHLRYFVALAEQLNFTRAARAVAIAQPPFSQQIRRLEGELGGPLFYRTSRRVRLTDLGEALLPRARLILAQAREATQDIRALLGLERGVLRVGASGALARHLLPDFLDRFRTVYPGVELLIREQRTPQLLRSVEAFDLDAALIRLPHPPTSLETTVLGTERLVAVLPRSHPCARARSVPLRALRDDPFVMLADPSEPFYRHVVDLCVRDGFTPSVICTGAEYATACRLVGLGMGVSIISVMGSRLSIDPAPAFVPLENEDAVSPIVLIARPNDELSVAARAFVKLVRERPLSFEPGGAGRGPTTRRSRGRREGR
jgi:DNA-binding transcriptional LysR family regulator